MFADKYEEKIFDDFDDISLRVFSIERLKKITKVIFRTPPINYNYSDEQIQYRLAATKTIVDAVRQELVSLLQRNYHSMITGRPATLPKTSK